MKDKIYNSIIGFIVGDALGVPVEFMSKEQIKKLDVQDFVETGRSGQPIGSWSDDSSMMLCLIETINENGLDFDLYSKKIVDWLYNGYMTPNGKTFGVGRGTFFSLGKLRQGVSYLSSGEKGLNSNGNGSLMRILPLVFYLKGEQVERYNNIQTCSAITHAHDISKIACCIYCEYFWQLMACEDKIKAYKKMQEQIKTYFADNEFLSTFDNILNQNIYEKDYDALRGEGYVLYTLEVALHCFINGKSYKDCVLKAIEIGNDTDTNAAITGALAGYYYNEVPQEWVDKIIEIERINKLADVFIEKCK